jgi:hypothetical protein
MGYARIIGAIVILLVDASCAWAGEKRDYAQDWISAECYSGRCSLSSAVLAEKAAMGKCSVIVFDRMPSYDEKYDDAVWWKYAEMFDQCVDEAYSPE